MSIAPNPNSYIIPKIHPAVATTTNGRRFIIDDCFLDYLDMVSDKLGLPKYEEWQEYSDGDRKSYFRSEKIKNILEDGGN